MNPKHTRRVLAALALLALPLAGCTAPAMETPLEPTAHTETGPLGLAATGQERSASTPRYTAPARLQAGPLDDIQCGTDVTRSEETHGAEVIIRILGCVHASVKPPVGGSDLRPFSTGDINETFTVDEGAANFTLIVHLHGDEEIRTFLKAPNRAIIAQDELKGGAENSYARYVVEKPQAGTWRIEGFIWETTVAREWSVIATVNYA